MELAFQTRDLRDICETERVAKRKFGERLAKSLQRRLADLRAATSINDLVAGRPRELDRTGQRFAIELGNGFSLVFTANHNVIPRLRDGRVDWENVTRVKLLSIEQINA